MTRLFWLAGTVQLVVLATATTLRAGATEPSATATAPGARATVVVHANGHQPANPAVTIRQSSPNARANIHVTAGADGYRIRISQ